MSDTTKHEPLRIWCEGCRAHQPMQELYLHQDTVFPEQGIWGDIQCDVCKLVIASVKGSREGVFGFEHLDSHQALIDALEDMLAVFAKPHNETLWEVVNARDALSKARDTA